MDEVMSFATIYSRAIIGVDAPQVKTRYGVFDFIYTSEGKYVFLECNSDRQWAFLEKEPKDCLITTMFADKIKQLCL